MDGLMNIADKSGLIALIAKKLQPLMRFIFPEEKNQKTIAMMVMSFIANIFGAGNSATVFSLKSMEMLECRKRPQSVCQQHNVHVYCRKHHYDTAWCL